MFNLSSLKVFDGKIALIHHETVDSSESFTYRQIQNDSLTVKSGLDRVLIEESSGGDRIWRQYNVVIALSTHSPALLPAIIG